MAILKLNPNSVLGQKLANGEREREGERDFPLSGEEQFVRTALAGW